jgi:hypothetical protein
LLDPAIREKDAILGLAEFASKSGALRRFVDPVAIALPHSWLNFVVFLPRSTYDELTHVGSGGFRFVCLSIAEDGKK